MKKASDDLYFLYTHADATLKYMAGKQIEPFEMLLYCLLERLRHVSLSLEFLLQDSGRINAHEFAIGVLLRSAMLDTLIGIDLTNHLVKLSSSADEEIRDELNKIAIEQLADGFQKTFDHVNSQLEDKIITKEELARFYKTMVERYPLFFEEYAFDETAPKLRHKRFKAPQALYKVNKQGGTKELVHSVYDLYLFYSKYDHVNIFSLDFIRIDKDHRGENILKAVDHMKSHAAILHRLFLGSRENDSFLSEQSKKILEYAE